MSLAEIHKKAKLVMIPSGFKSSSSTDNLYSVIPSNGDGDFNYAGTTNGTRVNKDGLIEIASSNQPRLDYSPSNPQNPHLLLEPSKQNLVTHSENFDNYFTKFNSNNTPNVDTSPLGSFTANKFFTDSNNSAHTLFKIETVSTNPFTFSIFAKKLQKNFIQIILGSDFGNTHSNINLENGVVTAESGHTTDVQNYGNGWYRISATATPSGTSGYFSVGIIDASDSARNASSQGDGSSGILIWGAQIEQSSVATSYIPTSSSATTRTVDTCNSAGNSTIINTSEGVLFAEIAALANDSSLRDISVSNGSTDRILLSYLNSSNRIAMQFIDGGASQFTLQFDGATITNFNKIAIKYKSSDYALWVNGSERATNTSHTNALAGLDRINFDRGDGGDDFFGKCKQLMYFDTILTDAELTTLTT